MGNDPCGSRLLPGAAGTKRAELLIALATAEYRAGRLARFEGLPDEGAGVARTALQAGYGVAEAGTVPGRQPPSGDTERQSQYTARTAPCRPVAG